MSIESALRSRAARGMSIAAALAAASCSYVPAVTPYRIDIQQGNFITQEMVSQLKAGMSREQVRFVLGTPLIADIFHADRWDYVYYRDPRSGSREQRRIAVFFSDNKLTRVDGDVVPAAAAPVTAEEPTPATGAPQNAAEQKAAPEKTEPAAPARPAADAPTTQNWHTASDAPPPPEAQSAPAESQAAPGAPAAEQGEPKAAQGGAEKAGPPEARKERGFFGRMLEKIGL